VTSLPLGVATVKLPRRRFLGLAGITFALPALTEALAGSYPTRPVHLLVGYAPGGPLDISARLIAQWLSEHLGQSFIVENQPGAGSNIATANVVRAPPDGYTLLEISASNAWNSALYDNLTFDILRDIVPIAGVRRAGGVLEVTPDFPAKTVPEFIAYAKKNPGKINVASAGTGSAPHLFAELFKAMADVDFSIVNYRGSGPALPDVMSGQVQAMFDVVSSSIGHIKSGKLRPLGVTTDVRLNVLPDIPPIGDFVPGYEASSWDGIGAPANTPSEVVDILSKEVDAALRDDTFKGRLADLGVEPFRVSPVEFREFIKSYTKKWADVIHRVGIKVE
jgi:tripartite-type tricarboxylate transporter receptor subunit TctC